MKQDTQSVEQAIALAKAAAWDEAAQAFAWCLDNGPAESAARYVVEHNPYRGES